MPHSTFVLLGWLRICILTARFLWWYLARGIYTWPPSIGFSALFCSKYLSYFDVKHRLDLETIYIIITARYFPREYVWAGWWFLSCSSLPVTRFLALAKLCHGQQNLISRVKDCISAVKITSFRFPLYITRCIMTPTIKWECEKTFRHTSCLYFFSRLNNIKQLCCCRLYYLHVLIRLRAIWFCIHSDDRGYASKTSCS